MFASFLASLILSTMTIQQACGEDTGCTIVQSSEYEETFGIKNSHFGLVAFSVLAILSLLELRKPNKYKRKLLKTGLIFGGIFALYFLYLQVFMLSAVCKYCLVVDFGALISLGLVFLRDK